MVHRVKMMTNEVLQTLEDSAASAQGGAYP